MKEISRNVVLDMLPSRLILSSTCSSSVSTPLCSPSSPFIFFSARSPASSSQFPQSAPSSFLAAYLRFSSFFGSFARRQRRPRREKRDGAYLLKPVRPTTASLHRLTRNESAFATTAAVVIGTGETEIRSISPTLSRCEYNL